MFEPKQTKIPPKGKTPSRPLTEQAEKLRVIPTQGRDDHDGELKGRESITVETPKMMHNLSDHEASLLMENLTLKQLKYMVCRFVDPKWSGTTCATIAGYSKSSAQNLANQANSNRHLARIMQAARLNREAAQAPPQTEESLDRDAATALLSRFAKDTEYPAKVRMDAIKALRELEAWDKQMGNAHGINFLTVIMEQIDGRGVLPSRASSVQQLGSEGESMPSHGILPPNSDPIDVEMIENDVVMDEHPRPPHPS